MRGWDEFELEVMRDRNDNVVVVCSIENLDPMGVHTGDSVTVAPQMTLSDEAYQELRDAAARVIRAVGVETGGSNIQFARNRETGEVCVIEMNPRVSRSSALASKATGYPIAKVAAKLAVGYTLDEIPNDLTQTTPASFEPTLDYVVVKFPRFAFEKFPGADGELGTQMKSVGEAMGIGRTFTEAFLKAMRSRELDLSRATPTPWASLDEIPAGVHPWFKEQIARARRSLGATARAGGAHRRGLGRAQERRLVGRGDRRCVRRRRGARQARSLGEGRSARVPPRRLVRGRGRRALELPLLDLGRVGRGSSAAGTIGRDPRVGPEPDRPGHRVRLLLRPRGVGFPRARLRDRDGQLQPGDGVDGLRHLGSPLLRASGRRGGARDLRAGAPGGRRHPVRRPDPAQARPRDRGGGIPDPRHAVRRHRPRRGPRALRVPLRAAPARDSPLGNREDSRRGDLDRRSHRLPGARAAVLRPRWQEHARLLRPGRPAGRRRPRGRDDAGRPFPRERRGDRRRRAVRR